MKAHYKTADGRIVFEVNGETPKAVFEQIAGVQELFEAEPVCGACRSSEGKGIRYQVRHAEKDGRQFKYYELRCLQCFARFQFGQASEGGGLFPKRKDKDGKPLPNRGWEKYERRPQPDTKAAAGAPAGRAASAPARPSGEYQDPYGDGPGVTDDDVPF